MSSEIERLRHQAEQDPAQLIKLADTLVANGSAGEAVAVCRRGHAAWPADVNVSLALGRALSAAGHLEEAQQVLLAAMSSKSTRPAGGAELRPPPAPKPKGPEESFADLSFDDPYSDDKTTQQRAPHFGGEEVTATEARHSDSTETSFEVVLDEPATRPGGSKPASQATTKARALNTPPRGESPSRSAPRGEPVVNRSAPRGEPVMPTPSRPAPRAEPVMRPPARQAPQGPIDLDAIARALLTDRPIDANREPTPEEGAAHDMQRRWQARRRNSFIWLWAGLVLVTAGSIAGYLYHLKAQAKELGELIAQGDAALLKASPEGDAAARDAFARATRIRPRDPKYSTLLGFAAARLHADQGEDTDAAAWAMLKRSEKEAKKNTDSLDARTVADTRRARALLALARGEPCPAAEPEDGDIAARCAVQKGDLDGARKLFAATIANGGDAKNIRALLMLGSLELGAGDLDAADGALRRVLAVAPDHPRALVGRAVVALEHGDIPNIEIPQVRLGVTTEAWFHLARGLAAISRGKAGDSATALSELDLARRGIVHEGRLALLYARSRLLLGQVGEAEQAMRVAERLDPNDVDVGVLDAEVALAKGYEDKVASALSVGPQTPRRLAVYGRALELIGKHKEAVTALETALARRPGDATTMTYRAIARAHLGESAAATRELEKAANQLSSPTPHYGIGLLAYERRDLPKARAEFEKATERNSEAFRARALLGRVLRDLGKTKEAFVELERAARESPNLMAVHATLARMYLELGRYREARAEMRKVLDNGKPSPDDKLVYAEATLALGFVPDAESVLGDVAGATPAKVARLKLVAQTWKGPKEAAAAAKILEKENKTAQGRDTHLVFALADAYRRAGDVKKASALLQNVISADALHANLGLGRLALASNDAAGAEAAYRAALTAWATQPYGADDHTDARIGLGRAQLQRKGVGDAVATLMAAIADDPQSPEARFWLARAYQEQNDKDKARIQASRATELDDHYAEAYALVGNLWKSDNKDKARTAYKKYLEVSPDGPQSKQVKKNLAGLK